MKIEDLVYGSGTIFVAATAALAVWMGIGEPAEWFISVWFLTFLTFLVSLAVTMP